MSPADPSHPDAEQLERFILGEQPRSEVAVVVRHMLTGCPLCLEVTRRLWSLADRAPRGLLALVGGRETSFVATAGDSRQRGVL
ncbi:MAG TPA: hypothetical protein VGX68_04280 [Thermoanaerobaculia bacterium]|jgi:hypothetical protein|nr:hypothetical protein [Thermoanaerobaculia bacterium]